MTAPAPVPDGTTPPAEAVEAVMKAGDSARPHLIQYRDPDGFHSTTVACWDHESAILAVLRAEGIGCSATTAPILSRCDGCENDRARASALRERRADG